MRSAPRRGTRIGWALVVVASVAGGCRSNVAPAPGETVAANATPSATPSATVSPRRGPAWSGSGAFKLYVTDFHFELGGTQVFAVDETGSVRDMFVTNDLVATSAFCADAGPDIKEICKDLTKRGEAKVGVSHWHIAEYTLDDAAKVELRKLVADAKLGTLEPRYASSQIPDGTTRDYRLVTSEGKARVSAYSISSPAEPPALLPLLRFVQSTQKAHADARTRAGETTSRDRTALEREATGD